jgi:hypothetical protein
MPSTIGASKPSSDELFPLSIPVKRLKMLLRLESIPPPKREPRRPVPISMRDLPPPLSD